MNTRPWVLAICGFLLPLGAVSPACAQMGGGGGLFDWSPPSTAEVADYNAFMSESDVDTRIELGEQFDRNYLLSEYSLAVDSALVFLYYNRGSWAKFYAAADRVVAGNPNDFIVMRLAGWVIANNYNPTDPKAEANLSKAEKYEKRALALVAAMKKPKTLTDTDFNQEKASDEWQAHSGLGMIYFRRKDYAGSAKEYQLAAEEESPQPSPSDLYMLAIDLENLNRANDAVDVFRECAVAFSDKQERCAHGTANPAEEAAYEMFRNEANVGAKIKLAESFDAQFVASSYQETVDSALVTLYETQGQWDKFYATADRVIAKDPDNVGILTLLGWTIARLYDPDEPGAAAKLAESEQYEKHALELIATMKKTDQLSSDQFNLARNDAAWQAHSGLGLTYFRLDDYADSAKELQAALEETSRSDSLNLYALGIDLRKLNRNAEAVEAFTKCGAIPGTMRAQCIRDAAAVRKDVDTPPPPAGTAGSVNPTPAAAE